MQDFAGDEESEGQFPEELFLPHRRLLPHRSPRAPHTHRAQGPATLGYPALILSSAGGQTGGFGGGESCSPPPPVFAQDSLRGNRPTLQQEELRLDGRETSRCVKGGCSEAVFLHLLPQ